MTVAIMPKDTPINRWFLITPRKFNQIGRILHETDDPSSLLLINTMVGIQSGLKDNISRAKQRSILIFEGKISATVHEANNKQRET